MDLHSWTGWDTAVIVLLALPAIVGWIWGLWATLCRFAGLVLCVPLAWALAPLWVDALQPVDAQWRYPLARLITGLLVLVLGSVLGALGTKFLKTIQLNWLNRFGGGVSGLIGGALLSWGLLTGGVALYHRGVLTEAPRGLLVPDSIEKNNEPILGIPQAIRESSD